MEILLKSRAEINIFTLSLSECLSIHLKNNSFWQNSSFFSRLDTNKQKNKPKTQITTITTKQNKNPELGCWGLPAALSAVWETHTCMFLCNLHSCRDWHYVQIQVEDHMLFPKLTTAFCCNKSAYHFLEFWGGSSPSA